MVLDDKVLEVTLNGIKYVLTYPSVDRLEIMAEEEKKGTNNVAILREMLIECGLPEKPVRKLQAWHMQALAKELTSTGK